MLILRSISLVWLCLVSLSVGAEQRAVVIGVADYPYLDAGHALVGPLNDADLLSAYFTERGFGPEQLIVLTDNQDETLLPNKNNILRVINQQIEELNKGDFLYLHFSGHGSQQPAKQGDDEIDGLTEIFLPRDTKKWNGQTGQVTNAITDDEIAGLLAEFQNKGIFVWLVFDSCHSGTMSRSTWRSRKLTASALGLPKTRSTSQPKRESNLIESATGGGFVAFFAAQTNEETPEMKLPKRSAEAGTYGLFTFQLLEALRTSDEATYRQIADQIVQFYHSYPWYGSSPMFIGESLDEPVFQGEVSPQVHQWQIQKNNGEWRIPAGFLRGLGLGSTFLIVEKPTDADEVSVGSAEVTALGADSSVITMAEGFEVPKLGFARLKGKGVDLGLSVSTVAGSSSGKLSKALEQLEAEIGLTQVSSTEFADVRLLERGEAVVLLTEGETLPCKTCSLSGYVTVKNDSALMASLGNALNKLGKALNLTRLGSVLSLDGLDTVLNVTRSGSNKTEQFGVGDVPELFSGDSISLTIANFLEVPLDITVLFVSSDYGIDVVFPQRGSFNRFMEEEERTIPLGRINAKTTGMERLVIIASTASRTSAPANYSFLAQSSVQRTRSSTTALGSLLSDAGFGGLSTRSASGGSKLAAESDIHTIAWITSKK